MTWIIWGILLFLQNAAHTVTSRSRNSASVMYTAIASVFSNGVWFASQFYIVNELIAAKQTGWLRFIAVLAFYILFTVAGSVFSHWYFMAWEKRRGIVKA